MNHSLFNMNQKIIRLSQYVKDTKFLADSIDFFNKG